MRFRDLDIRTRRETPTRARAEGQALLIRAGYLTDEGQPTALGCLAIDRLKSYAYSQNDLLSKLGLPATTLESRDVVFEIPSGAVEILQCPACKYSAESELARIRKRPALAEPMLPLKKVSTPDCDTIESLVTFLGVSKAKTAKALMYSRVSDGQFIFVLVRGDMQLSARKFSRLVGSVEPAGAEQILKVGAVAGYASPIGLSGALVVVDDSIPATPNLVAGANEVGYHLQNTNYGLDYTAQIVADLVVAHPGDPCPQCETGLVLRHATVLQASAAYQYLNILSAAAQTHRDERGLCLPAAAAPFDVHLMQVPSKHADTRSAADQLYREFEAAKAAILFDDRDERAGVKFNDADLIGCPVRVTVGEKQFSEGMVELKARRKNEVQLASFSKAVRKALDIAEAMNA